MSDERTRSLLRRALATKDPLDVMAWRHAQGLRPFVEGDRVRVKWAAPAIHGDIDRGPVVEAVVTEVEFGGAWVEWVEAVSRKDLLRVGVRSQQRRRFALDSTLYPRDLPDVPRDVIDLLAPARCDECLGEAWAACECQGTGWRWPEPRDAPSPKCPVCGHVDHVARGTCSAFLSSATERRDVVTCPCDARTHEGSERSAASR